MPVSLADLLPDPSRDPSSDVLLDRFLEYSAGRRLTLYRASSGRTAHTSSRYRRD